MIDFSKIKTSRTDAGLITAIAMRANNSFAAGTTSVLELSMDLTLVHAKYPLDLRRLEAADNENFYHDIYGIQRHLDRETGELRDHFVPRYTKRDGVKNSG